MTTRTPDPSLHGMFCLFSVGSGFPYQETDSILVQRSLSGGGQKLPRAQTLSRWTLNHAGTEQLLRATPSRCLLTLPGRGQPRTGTGGII